MAVVVPSGVEGNGGSGVDDGGAEDSDSEDGAVHDSHDLVAEERDDNGRDGPALQDSNDGEGNTVAVEMGRIDYQVPFLLVLSRCFS